MKRSFCAIALSLTLLSSLMPFNSANAATLHPTGLLSLKEGNIPKAQQIFTTTKASLPSSVDLSASFPQPGNQGELGSCVAWATGYAYKSFQEKKEMGWDYDSNSKLMSPSFIYNQIHIDNSKDGGGTYFSSAFNLLKEQGCVTLDKMPYDGRAYAYNVIPQPEMIAAASDYKASSWGSLPGGDINEIKAHIAKGDGVVIGVPVYPDFDNISPSNKVYDYISGTSRGNHALCIVGYDDNLQAVKFINSWGTDWGINGYGWISYDLIRNNGWTTYVMTDVVANHVEGYVKSSESGVGEEAYKDFTVDLVDSSGYVWKNVRTNEKGYFDASNIPTGVYTVRISKSCHLIREIPNVNVSSTKTIASIGSKSSYVELYIGDMPENGIQDGAINMADVMQVSKAFNTVKDDANYDAQKDLNKDGAINLEDVMIISKHFNCIPSSYPKAEVSYR